MTTNEPHDTIQPPAPEEPQKPEKPTIGDFLKGIKVEVEHGTERVMDMARDVLVQKELGERRDAFLAAIAKLQDLRRDGHKIKPDVGIMFDAEGKPAGTPGFSKEKAEELKKNREAIEKVERVIEKAIGGDFSKLKEIGK
jgi:hypothetical protein